MRKKSLFLLVIIAVIFSSFFNIIFFDKAKKENIFIKFLPTSTKLPIYHGINGEKVVLPKEKKKEARKNFKFFQFNVVASDLINPNRNIPDTRHSKCEEQTFTFSKLPKTSLIIIFHNEASSTLIRTIHSCFWRGPSSLILEIILVDDSSSIKAINKFIEQTLIQLPVPVKKIILETRMGLVTARLKGASVARGEILTFIDSHCECNVHWLKPLLYRVSINKETIATPVIDVIDHNDFSYKKSSVFIKGVFSWTLDFKWMRISEEEKKKNNYSFIEPIKTPIMAGGLFSINKVYFELIGKYDDQMKIWGGENLEISFRTWMCGGQVLIDPCSRVGHVFRSKTPYTFPGGLSYIIKWNKARLATVWLDKWKNFYFKLDKGRVFFNIQMVIINNLIQKIVMQTIFLLVSPLFGGNVNERIKLKYILSCHSFDWYLKNIFHQPSFPVNEKFFGQISDNRGYSCLEMLKNNDKNKFSKSHYVIIINICNQSLISQMFTLTAKNQLVNDLRCLVTNHNKQLYINQANQVYPFSTWDFKENKIINIKTNDCLEIFNKTLRLRTCAEKISQKWKFVEIIWDIDN